MKTHIVAAAAAAFFAAAAQADLVIEVKVESPQVNSMMTAKIKGEKTRTDIAAGPMGAMSVIMDSKTGDTVNLMHPAKVAMKANAAQMKDLLAMSQRLTGATGQPAQAEKTGKSEKIGEYDCEIYGWSSGQASGRCWVAKSHPQAAILKDAEKRMKSGMLSGAAQMGPDTDALPGPVLKSETIAAGATTTATIISVKEQKLDDKDFEVPADYKAMAMPGLGAPGAGGQPGAVPRPK